ncbi:MAG: PEGA domain-containing protein [Planctomycetaceae bacterium]
MSRTLKSESIAGRQVHVSMRPVLALLLGAIVCSSLTGCVFRRMTIRSDPPGALVMVDGEEVGYTPCSVPFVYYGTREITLVKPGYQTLKTMQKLQTPWYQYFPLEFATDNFSPQKITDRHNFLYQLQPQAVVPTNELYDRARSLRSESQVRP